MHWLDVCIIALAPFLCNRKSFYSFVCVCLYPFKNTIEPVLNQLMWTRGEFLYSFLPPPVDEPKKDISKLLLLLLLLLFLLLLEPLPELGKKWISSHRLVFTTTSSTSSCTPGPQELIRPRACSAIGLTTVLRYHLDSLPFKYGRSFILLDLRERTRAQEHL